VKLYEAKSMVQISLEIPDEFLQQLTEAGKTPAEVLQERLVELSGIFGTPFALSQRFEALATQWRRETRHMSLMSDIVLNRSYQQIIGLGKPAIALILQDLKQQPDHWFWALRSITGENPIRPEDRGQVPQMAEAWLVWGRQHGYQC
jgi:hypothetical protein